MESESTTPGPDIERLFRVVFPGETCSDNQRGRLAAQLRSIADAVDPEPHDDDEARHCIDEDRRTSGNEASVSGQDEQHQRATASAEAKAVAPQSKKQRRHRHKGRPFDITAYHTRYVALEIAYLGWDFHGFAAQADTENTIEGHFFAALKRVRLIPEDADWQALRYSRCGRTDKGVSALGQVVALLLRSNAKTGQALPEWHDEQDYPAVINRQLPDSIRVLGWTDAPQDFHARFDAAYREYKYFLVQDDERRLDVAAMQRAADYTLGEHDFRNFCKMDVQQVLSFRRTILSFRVEPCSSSIAGRDVTVLHLRGTAFLWHQVRCLAAVLLMVGHGEEAPEVVRELLDVDAHPSKPYYAMAPEEPLLLAGCVYKETISFHRSPGAQAALREIMRALVNRQIIGASLLATMEARIAADATDAPLTVEARALAVRRRPPPHAQLLRRATEPSMQERLHKLGKTALGVEPVAKP